MGDAMGSARRLAMVAWRAADDRMRAAGWIASAAGLLGIGLAWAALRVVGLYGLWTIGTNEGLQLVAEFVVRAVLLAATAVCVLLGVARRSADGGRRGVLVAAIVLAGVVAVAQLVQLTSLMRFEWRAVFSVSSLSWLVFAALTVVAAVLALTAQRPTALRPPAQRADVGDSADVSEPGRLARAAAPYVWFSVTAAFVAFVASVLVVAQALIVPNAWGPALVALAQAGVTVLAVAVQVVAGLFVVRGSALGRLVVSAVAVVLLGDALGSGMLGVVSDGGVAGGGLIVATVCATAAAVPLWLPPVSRYLAEPPTSSAAAGGGRAAVGERPAV